MVIVENAPADYADDRRSSTWPTFLEHQLNAPKNQIKKREAGLVTSLSLNLFSVARGTVIVQPSTVH